MKILGISLGTKNGNNDNMCKEALMGAKEVGAEVEFIHALDLDIKYCTGCVSCSRGLVMGKGNRCSLKDDFDWLLDKCYEADGILWTIPIFEKGTTGLMHTITDRFGPRMDRGMNIIGTKMAEEAGGKVPDPRFLTDRVVSYIGIGGSDWGTQFHTEAMMQGLTPAWKIIEVETFQWSKTIVMEDDKVARIRQIGRNLAEAAKDIENAKYVGDPGVCPHCHSRNFHFSPEGETICCLCGMKGEIKWEDGKAVFTYPEEQLKHAHDTLSGKFIHADDIKNNEGRAIETLKSPEYKVRVQAYKDFITPSVPQR